MPRKLARLPDLLMNIKYSAISAGQTVRRCVNQYGGPNRSTMRQPVRWAEPFDNASTSTVGRAVRRCVTQYGGPNRSTMHQPVRWAEPFDDASRVGRPGRRCVNQYDGPIQSTMRPQFFLLRSGVPLTSVASQD